MTKLIRYIAIAGILLICTQAYADVGTSIKFKGKVANQAHGSSAGQ